MARAETSIYPQREYKSAYFGRLSSDVRPAHRVSTAAGGPFRDTNSRSRQGRASSDPQGTGRNKLSALGLQRPCDFARTSEGRNIYQSGALGDINALRGTTQPDSFFYEEEITDADILTIADPLILLQKITGTRHVACDDTGNESALIIQINAQLAAMHDLGSTWCDDFLKEKNVSINDLEPYRSIGWLNAMSDVVCSYFIGQ